MVTRLYSKLFYLFRARARFQLILHGQDRDREFVVATNCEREVSVAPFVHVGVREALSKVGMRIIRPLSELTSAICQRRQIEHRSHTHEACVCMCVCRHIWRPLIFQIALDSRYGVLR